MSAVTLPAGYQSKVAPTTLRNFSWISTKAASRIRRRSRARREVKSKKAFGSLDVSRTVANNIQEHVDARMGNQRRPHSLPRLRAKAVHPAQLKINPARQRGLASSRRYDSSLGPRRGHEAQRSVEGAAREYLFEKAVGARAVAVNAPPGAFGAFSFQEVVMFSFTRLFQAGYVLGLLMLVALLAWPSPSSGQFRRGGAPPPAIPPLNNLNTDSTGNFGLAGFGGFGGFNGFSFNGFSAIGGFGGGFNGLGLGGFGGGFNGFGLSGFGGGFNGFGLSGLGGGFNGFGLAGGFNGVGFGGGFNGFGVGGLGFGGLNGFGLGALGGGFNGFGVGGFGGFNGFGLGGVGGLNGVGLGGFAGKG